MWIMAFYNPSVTASRATSLYTREAYGGIRLRVASTNCMAGRPIKAHLCVAGNIRAIPETEIPPAMRVDFYYIRAKGGGNKKR